MARINISQILMKRGNTTAAGNYIGPLGELVVDTGLKTVRIQDGVTAGGMAVLATLSGYNQLSGNIANLQTTTANISANLSAFQTYANTTFGTSNFGNANVASYLTTSNVITGIDANVTAANLQIANLWSNAGVQADTIAILTANAGVQSANIATLVANAGVQADAIAGANAAIITANTALKGYVDTQLSTLTNGASTALDTLLEIGTALGNNANFSATMITWLGNVTANTTAANTAIDTLQANLGGYYTWANANVAGLYTSILGANTAWQANARVQADAITSLQANITAANLAIAAASGTYSNTNVAAYLSASTTGNVGAGNLTVVNNFNSNIISANSFTYANGVSILAGIGGTYGNANVAAYLTINSTVTALQANIGSFYTYANATYTGGAGTTYTNANVVSMLAANSAVFIGNVGVIGNVATGNIQANATAIFLGGNTVISNYGSPTFGYATHIGNNIYFDANGVQRYRNTQTGAADLIVAPGTLNFYATSGAVTANTATGYTGATSLYMALSTSGMSLYNSAGLVSSGPVTIQSATGLVTNQATIAVFNGVGSTINMGGVATTITLGQSTPGTSSNVFVGNTVGTQTGNLTVRARGQYNYTTQYGVAGGYNSPPYTAQSLTGGSGTGMTATYSSSGGYVSFPITIVNPGTGYKNGDVLTLPGGLGATAQIWNYNSNYVGQTGQSDITFTIDGNLILPGNVTLPNIARITYANGVNFLSTVTGTYSNTNVAAYLTTDSTVTALQANLGVTQIWANANIASINANLGSYYTWANANVAGLSNSIIGANASIATLQANLGSYYTWANANVAGLQTSITSLRTDANTNTAAYLAAGISTNVTTTGNISATNVIVNGQPTTYGKVNPAFMVVGLASSVTSFGNGSTFILDTVVENINSQTSYNTSTGVFTLTAGVTYDMSFTPSFITFSNTTGGYLCYDWVDATSNALLDTTGIGTGTAIPTTESSGQIDNPTARVIYTPSTNQTVKLRVTSANGTATLRGAIGTQAIVRPLNLSIAVQATATGTVSKNYAKYTRTASQSVSANSVVICNVAESSSGTAVSVNTTTGQVTLTGGKTYRLRGTAGTTVGSAAGSLLGYGWYNETTSAWIGEGAGLMSPGSTNYNTSTSGTAEYVFAPSSTTVVSLRVIYTNNISSIGGNQSDFAGTYANPWIDIEEISASFALNALDTITTTGNVTVGGDLSVTGNITSTPVGFRATTPVTNMTVNNGASATMLFGTEEVDTKNCYDPATGKFTPNVAGYYAVNWYIVTSANGAGELYASLNKNGVLVAWGNNQTTATAHWNGMGGSVSMLYLNGTTDYISIILTNNSGSTATILAASGLSCFSAHLIR